MRALSDKGAQAIRDYVTSPDKVRNIHCLGDNGSIFLNKFVSNTDFKSFFHQLLVLDPEFQSFSQTLDTYIMSLDMDGWEVSLLQAKSTSYQPTMKFDIFIKGVGVRYSIGIQFGKIKVLDHNVLASFYILVGQLPLFREYTGLVKTEVLTHCTVSDQHIRKTVLQAYKQLSRQHLMDNNARLRAQVHRTVCSKEFKDRFSELRRDVIRPTMLRGIRDMLKYGTMEDIEYFISEVKIEDVMNS